MVTPRAHGFQTLAMCNVDDISLVEQLFHPPPPPPPTGITDTCLRNPKEATTIVHEAEPVLLKRDQYLTLMEAQEHQSLKHILTIKCWLRIWDNALDRGCAGTVATQVIRFLATPAFSDRKCSNCLLHTDPGATCAEHFISCLSPFLLLNIFVQSLRTWRTQFFYFLKLFPTYCMLLSCSCIHAILYTHIPCRGCK